MLVGLVFCSIFVSSNNKQITFNTMENNVDFTCVSWLSGKHSEDIEINTSLPYVSIYDYYSQGDDADKIINEINYIFNTKGCTVLEACEIWASMYL